jgi:hypothetical protein
LFVRFGDVFDCYKQNKREGELKESRVEILREKKYGKKVQKRRLFEKI